MNFEVSSLSEVYWLRYIITMRKQNTANVYSQLGRRKTLKLSSRDDLKIC